MAETRILYIDDDLALAELVKRRLSRAGHDVVHTQDPDTALLHIGQEPFDAVVLDHYLGSGTGHEVLAKFRELNYRVPVVYITGSNEAQVAIEAMKNGASDYVIKSVSDDFFPLLIDAIQQTVANARLRAEKEKADEETRIAKERAEALLAEMNHRVANSLALVAGLLRLQISNSQHPEIRHALGETQGRIAAIASMHRGLYTSDNVNEVEMQPYLTALVQDIGATLAKGAAAPILTADVDAVNMRADNAVSVGMIVSELVTNALKYAYPEGQSGEIRISFKKLDDSTARLAVEDDGVGLQASTDNNGRSTGLGSKIIKTMSETVGSGVVYPDVEAGTVVEVIVDLSK